MKAFFYDWLGLNVWLFHTINQLHFPALDACMELGTRLADHDNFPAYAALIALALLAVGWKSGHDKRLAWSAVLVVFVLAHCVDGWLVTLLKQGFAYPRPIAALPADTVYVLGAREYNLMHSFPSGHASFAMLLAASLWPVLTRWGRGAAAVFVIWVGISRVSLGAHFPADVLAGVLTCWWVVVLVRNAVGRLMSVQRL